MKVKVKSLRHVRLSAIPWTAAHQTPPSMGLSRQEDWSGVPLPSPIYTLPCVKQTELSPVLCDDFERWDGRRGRSGREAIYVYV